MSYQCQVCEAVKPHGTPSVRIVTERREHQHPFRKEANRDRSDDQGGKGSQIVRELVVCPPCAEAA